jgi:hypothetical protein
MLAVLLVSPVPSLLTSVIKPPASATTVTEKRPWPSAPAGQGKAMLRLRLLRDASTLPSCVTPPL